MAEKEEKEEEKEQADAAPQSKKGSMKKLIIIGVAALLVGGGGFGGWWFFINKKGEDAASAEKETEVKPGVAHELEPFIVNLQGNGGKRLLKARIELEVNDEEAVKALEGQTAQARDAILLLLTEKTADQVLTLDGKVELRTELLARVNQALEDIKVRNLYFTEFVVQ